MKKGSCLFLIFFALFFGGIFSLGSVSAEETISSDDAFYSPEFNSYVVPFKQRDDGKLEPLSKEEYNKAIEQEGSFEDESDDTNNTPLTSPNKEKGVTPQGYREYYKFVHTTSSNYIGNPIKVSADIGCNKKIGSCSLGHGETYTTSISVTYGGANVAQKSAIKSSLGINFTKSKAITTSFTFNIKAGQKGYVAFKPYKVKKNGY